MKNPSPDSKLYIGIDVGGTKIQSTLISSSGSILANNRGTTPRDCSFEVTLDAIEASVTNLLQSMGMAIQEISGVGIAVPGVVMQETGFVVVTPNMNLSGVNLGQLMGARLKVPVKVGNDCNLGTLGECWLGSGRNAGSCVGIFVGTGVGAGIVIDHHVFSGAGQAAGEIGHIVTQFPGEDWRSVLEIKKKKKPDSKTQKSVKKAVKKAVTVEPEIKIPDLVQCGCGNFGCFETFASRTAIERFIREAVAAGAKSSIVDLCGGNLNVIKSGTIAKALKANDKVVTAIVRYAAQIIGSACLTVRHLIDPEVIVLGGGVIEACQKYMMPIIDAVVANDQLPSAPGNRRILVSSLGDNSVVLGAVALARSEEGTNPLHWTAKVLPRYPVLKNLTDGVLHVDDAAFSSDFFILSDGSTLHRTKQPSKNPDGFRLKDIETAAAGGTDLLILATPEAGNVSLSGKCSDFLFRRGIDVRILSPEEAVHVYNSVAVRRAAVFHF